MLAKTAKNWLGIVAILVLGIRATASVQAASPTPISYCPYNITSPGNYVVTRDLTISGNCIEIGAVDNVALDLEGHSITGDGANGAGISCSSCNHIIVANGTVEKFAVGIFLQGGFNTVARMTVRYNTGSDRGTPGNGIVIAAPNVSDVIGGLNSVTVVTNSSAIGNTRSGIVCFGSLACGNSIVSGSEAKENGEDGIQGFGVINDSVANHNGKAGINTSGFVTRTIARENDIGILMGTFSSVMDSEAYHNVHDGISLNGNIGSITDSIADNNGGRGIFLSCPASAFRNKAINNPGGNLVTSDNTCPLFDNKTPP